MATLANDPKEGKTLLEYLDIHEPDKKQYGAFIGCFSFNVNNLNQFRLYGKDENKEGIGVSIILPVGFF